MGKRLAAEGFAVLVPNPFYRVAKAPFFENAANVNFQDPATRAKLQPLMASVNAAQAGEKDAAAYTCWHRRSRRACISPSRRTTISASPT